MKTPLALLLLFALTPACSINFGGLGEKVSRDSTLHFEYAPGTDSLRIDSFNGSITVAAGEDATALDGTAVVWARGRTQDHASERIGQMEWQFDQVDSTVVMKLIPPTGGSNNAGSKITKLVVPAGWSLDIDTSNGNVTVPAGFGDIRIDTANGAVSVVGDGKVFVDTSNGRVDFSGSSQDFDLDSSNGRITIQLKGDWSGSGTAHSSNGKITVSCNGVIDARLSTSTSNGKARVYGPELSRDSGKGSLDLDTSNGNISVTHAFRDE